MEFLLGNALSDGEQERLDRYLGELENARIPNMEALDGFFASLVCCPDFIKPSEFLEVIDETIEGHDERTFESDDEVQDFINLVLRHYRHVSEQISDRDMNYIYMPFLQEDADGKVWGNDWAKGFLSGMNLRVGIWSALLENDEQISSVIPIFALAYEHDEDPKMSFYKEPLSDARRNLLFDLVTTGVSLIYAYFEDQRGDYLPQVPRPAKSEKVGRNTPCPCGSGRKFKRCCGGSKTVH